MTATGGLPLRESVKWCGEDLGVREGSRLRQLAGHSDDAQADHSDAECESREVTGVGAGMVE
ncbi:MAG: hypothetical protein WA991_12230 [Ornithinimicrobium sp.]